MAFRGHKCNGKGFGGIIRKPASRKSGRKVERTESEGPRVRKLLDDFHFELPTPISRGRGRMRRKQHKLETAQSKSIGRQPMGQKKAVDVPWPSQWRQMLLLLLLALCTFVGLWSLFLPPSPLLIHPIHCFFPFLLSEFFRPFRYNQELLA